MTHFQAGTEIRSAPTQHDHELERLAVALARLLLSAYQRSVANKNATSASQVEAASEEGRHGAAERSP